MYHFHKYTTRYEIRYKVRYTRDEYKRADSRAKKRADERVLFIERANFAERPSGNAGGISIISMVQS